MSTFEPSIDPVCVGCRTAQGAVALRLEASAWRCPGCGAEHAIVDGVACLGPFPPEDPGIRDVPSWCERLSDLDPEDSEHRLAGLLGTYGVAHFPESAPPSLRGALVDQGLLPGTLSGWLAQHAAPAGPALELGAGPGGLAPVWRSATPGPIVLVDRWWPNVWIASQLALHGQATVPWREVGCRFRPLQLRAPALRGIATPLVADALNPPFRAASFGLVAAVNLLDSVPEPFILLGQLDALLAPGGLLVLGMAYHFTPAVQPQPGWIERPETLRAILSGAMPGLSQLSYELLEEDLAVPWVLPAHDRLTHRYLVHLLLLRKTPR